MRASKLMQRVAIGLGAALAAVALAACGGGGGSATSGAASAKSASLVGAVLDAQARSAGRVLYSAASGTCAPVTVQINDQDPFVPDVSEDCRFFVASLPLGDVTVTVSVDGVQGAVFLPDLKDGEIVELEVQAEQEDGKVKLRIDVVRWMDDSPPGPLPTVVNDDGVSIDLPPGTYDQTLTVNGDDFRLVGTEAPPECGEDGWPTITGAVLLKGDRAFVNRVKFLGLVTVRGDRVEFGTEVCFEGGLLILGHDAQVPGGGDGDPVVCEDRVTLDFEALFPGDSVEGEGSLSPLHIETAGNAVVVAEAMDPEAYLAPNEPAEPDLPVQNGCLGNPGRYDADGGSVYGQGFADVSEGAPHDMTFTFEGGRTVQEFSLRMLDLGDGLGEVAGCDAATAVVKLVALGAAGQTLATDAVTCGDLQAALDLSLEGDACTAANGQPGNRVLRVAAERIARVELRFDPLLREAGVAFDDVAFRVERKVDVDVLPTINLKSQGVIPVRLLGDACFDVTEIDPFSVRFGPAGAGIAHPKAFGHLGADSSHDDSGMDDSSGDDHLGDADADGFRDLVLHFRTQATGIRSGDTRACLEGRTVDGRNFYGCDWIRIVPDKSDKPEKGK